MKKCDTRCLPRDAAVAQTRRNWWRVGINVGVVTAATALLTGAISFGGGSIYMMITQYVGLFTAAALVGGLTLGAMGHVIGNIHYSHDAKHSEKPIVPSPDLAIEHFVTTKGNSKTPDIYVNKGKIYDISDEGQNHNKTATTRIETDKAEYETIATDKTTTYEQAK